MTKLNCLLFLLFAFLTATLNAQIQRGDATIGGSVFYEYGFPTKNTSSGSSVNLLAPAYGQMLTDRLMIGGMAQLFNETYSQRGSNNFRLHPYLRYYFQPKAQGTHWYIQAGTDRPSADYSFLWGFGEYTALQVGGNHFIRPNVALEASLTSYYSYSPYHFGLPDAPSFELKAGLRSFLRQESSGDWKSGSGQVNQGTIILGNNQLELHFFPNNKNSFLRTNINTEASYFFADQWSAGLRIDYSRGNFNNTILNNTTTYLSFTPSLRYYFKSNGHVIPFGTVESSLGYSQNNFDDSLNDGQLNVRAGAGVAFFLNEALAIESLLLFDRSISGERSYMGYQIGLQYFLKNK
jgi:hypothetical protein